VYRSVTDEQHNTTTQKPKRGLSVPHTGVRNLPQQRKNQTATDYGRSSALNLNFEQTINHAHMLARGSFLTAHFHAQDAFSLPQNSRVPDLTFNSTIERPSFAVSEG
jgi:hypothetical protein